MDRFKKLLKSKGLKGYELAKMVGVSAGSLSERQKNPSVNTMKNICEALECEIHELFETPKGFTHEYSKKNGKWLGIRKMTKLELEDEAIKNIQ